MKGLSGKRYFNWIGFMHGTQKVYRARATDGLPRWAINEYARGWHNGFYSVCD